MVKEKRQKKRQKKPNTPIKLARDPVKLFYEVLFWGGLLAIAASYFYTPIFAVVLGLALIFLSLFVYELHHKEEEEKKRKGRMLTNIIFAMVVISVICFVYIKRGALIDLIRSPLSESWLLYLLLGLFLADLIIIASHIIARQKNRQKSRKTPEKAKSRFFEMSEIANAHAQGFQPRASKRFLSMLKNTPRTLVRGVFDIRFEAKKSKESKRKKEDAKSIKKKFQIPPEKKQLSIYTALFLVGIAVSITALFYNHWITFILSLVLSGLSLSAHKHPARPKSGKKEAIKIKQLQKFAENWKSKGFFKKPNSFIRFEIVKEKGIKEGIKDKGSQERLKQLREAEKKLLEEGSREKKILKELQKKKKQEEKLLRRKERLKRKEEKSRLKAERAKRKGELRETRKLEKAKERLKRFEKAKEMLKKKEELLLNQPASRGGRLLFEDINKLKNEVKKVGTHETDFDKLYELIERYDVIRLAEVSEIFGISKEKAEEWAQILEAHNLAIIHYPAIGGPELRKKGAAKAIKNG